MKLEIKKFSEPVLREPTEVVSDFGIEFQNLVDDLVETMRATNGVGLAAPQVNFSQKVIACEFTGEEDSELKPFPLTILCNPEITKSSIEQKNMVEGCLSFPGLEIIVKRPKEITVSGQDRYGKKVKLKADGLFARVLQHEIDHLNSTLLIDHIKKIDVIFIGTGTLGAPALEMLAVDPQYNIKLVITGESRVVSRNHKDKSSPIKIIAEKYKLPLLETANINEEAVVSRLARLKPQLGIMADFGQIISKEVIDVPKHGIINIHPSLLPKHRGPSPIQQTILEGDKETGVSLILTSSKMDAGDLISQASFPLRGSETAGILKNYMAKIGGSLVLNSIPYYITGDLKPYKQDETKATYSRLFKKEDGCVDLKTPKEVVDRKIRAFAEWPKAYALIKNKRVNLIAGHFEKDGSYLLDRVKPEGKVEMSYADFVRGYHTELTFK